MEQSKGMLSELKRALVDPTAARFNNAEGLYGQAGLRRLISCWLDLQLARCNDKNFALRFPRKYFADVPLAAFLHRIIRVGEASILAGIRFYGGDTKRGFVDVLAWDVAPDWQALCTAVATEWSDFQPFALRVLESDAPTSGARLDQSVHAAKVATMVKLDCDPRIYLMPCADADEAADVVAAAYEEFREDAPALADEVHPADAATLESCMNLGTLDFIIVEEQIAGLLATRPDAVEMLPGLVVFEEILLRQFRGFGFARTAQIRLAKSQAAVDPERVIIGTIQCTNHASRRTAERAGRPMISGYWFVDL